MEEEKKEEDTSTGAKDNLQDPEIFTVQMQLLGATDTYRLEVPADGTL